MGERTQRRAARVALDVILNINAIENMTDHNGAWIENIPAIVDLTGDEPEEPIPADQPPQPQPQNPAPMPPSDANNEDEPTGGMLEPDNMSFR